LQYTSEPLNGALGHQRVAHWNELMLFPVSFSHERTNSVISYVKDLIIN